MFEETKKRICDNCNGTGMAGDSACDYCAGDGTEHGTPPNLDAIIERHSKYIAIYHHAPGGATVLSLATNQADQDMGDLIKMVKYLTSKITRMYDEIEALESRGDWTV